MHKKGFSFYNNDITPREGDMINLGKDKKVSDVTSYDVITLEAEDTIKDAAILMKNNDIGFLPIINNDALIGVITDRDLVVRAYADGLMDNTKISAVMTPKCIAIEHNESADRALELMAEHKIRRLCVTEDGMLVGVCAIGDLAVSLDEKKETASVLSQISKPEKQNIFI